MHLSQDVTPSAMRLGSDGRRRDAADLAAARTARWWIPRPAGPGRRCVHVFRFDAIDAGGKRQLDSGANVAADGGQAQWRPDPLLPGGGRITCRDVATGVATEVSLDQD